MVNEELAGRFEDSLARWRAETGTKSSLLLRCSHPAFVEIVAMGWPVVPLIVEEIRKAPDAVFCALPRITGASVMHRRGRGRTDESCRAWVAWYDARQRPADARPGPATPLAKEIEALSLYAAGWDGRLAAAADGQSFKAARVFADLLGPSDPVPEPLIHPDGRAGLVFEDGSLYASLRFYGSSLAGYVRKGQEEWDGEVPFDGVRIPSVIRERTGISGRRA